MNKKIAILALVSTLALLGCNTEPAETASQPSAAPIDVAHVAYREVQSWHTYTTRLESPERVVLMPRVSGVVDQITFVEGQKVSQGQVLFKIDPRSFQAQVNRLQAQILSAEAALEEAERREKRAKNLGKTSAIAVEQIDSRSSQTKQRRAELLALRAELDAAQLDLGFTEVKSPIAGVISRAEITKGNNVTANQSVLTNIIADHQMYAYFNIDERTWNTEFQSLSADQPLPVLLALTGDKNSRFTGVIDFVDNAVNPSTGTIRVRANFEENDGQLRAGSFARLTLASSGKHKEVLVPDRAIGTDLKNRYVLVMTENNTLDYCLVEVGERYGHYRAIVSGLTPNDVIAVNGPGKAWPGMAITPREVSLDLSEVALTLKQKVEQNSERDDSRQPLLAARFH